MYSLGYFNFEQKNGSYLLTNDLGKYIFISPESFDALVKHSLDENTADFSRLQEKGFVIRIKRDILKSSFLK
jgi:hypothetical protein